MKNEVKYKFPMSVIALNFVFQHTGKISLSKSILIYPFISNNELLNILSRKGNETPSLEKLIINSASCFSNFDERYKESLSMTINAIQYLYQMNYINIDNGYIYLLKEIKYTKDMGKKLDKINKASKNISNILNEPVEKLYLNLKVTI
ncbi:three component ABC system middle component [Photobacterium leiognathi]|uniref:three component ABC system middle component n=1 Tax=Photobacterium leiognathi TaxID=553611 RepID=UPI00298167DC|nr:three component ABC system middle component [Photobacterium leiognathi]